MTAQEIHDLLIGQMLEVHARFPNLLLEKRAGGNFVVTGALGFRVEQDQREVSDLYNVEIAIPPDYPQSHPSAKEIGGRISKDFHTFSDDGTLCLGAPLAVAMGFAENRTLLGYIEHQVIPFLFSHSYNEKYGEMPHGELPHGTPGILQYYREMFGVAEDLHVLGLLKVLADDNYKGHMPCPCNSGLKLRKCHGPKLLKAKACRSPEWFLDEFVKLLTHVKGDGDIRKYLEVLPNEITKGAGRGKKT